MTESTDGALPNPGDQQNPDPAAVAAAAAAAANGENQPTDQDDADDIDLAALKKAQAEADAEDAAAGANSGQQAEPGQTQPNAQAQTQQTEQKDQTGQQQQPVMIPKARFDEVAGERDQARTDAAYWRGRAEAGGQNGQQQQPGAKPGEQQQQQQPTAEARLTAIQAKQDELAQKFDNGEITYSDLVKQQRELSNQEQQIREEMLLAKVKPATDGGGEKGNLYMETMTHELEKAHPWCSVFDAMQDVDEVNAAWDFVEKQARIAVKAQGIDTSTEFGVYRLREEAAKLADKFGPSLIGDVAKQRGIALPGQQQQQQQQAPQNPGPKKSPLALVREAKLDLAANAPPNVSAMSGTNASAGLTDAQIEAMSEEGYDALPDATRNALLGITG